MNVIKDTIKGEVGKEMNKNQHPLVTNPGPLGHEACALPLRYKYFLFKLIDPK